MTTVNCPYIKCIHNEGRSNKCSRDQITFTSLMDGEMQCDQLNLLREPRMEVPTKDLAIYTDEGLSEERGWIIKALEDDIWSDEDHWWRAQMYSRLAAIELFIHCYDEGEY